MDSPWGKRWTDNYVQMEEKCKSGERAFLPAPDDSVIILEA
jgi:hypothetical protein